ncbi:hypothetical protein PGH07_04585 [Sulfurovum sp. zt1-1]|uniref:Vitamin K epoxide reductase domain-containing protein n=1 Tax=Sulfurovum zhangzhouensis TaxID=3019067 RepID=A0ABT7QYQ9_9BACT|nr:hypothetical protein [Sulfurovum zhangzhouensis]MDM5271446.1 hypothetical protein [Sulfurovum zhangzhouensis]
MNEIFLSNEVITYLLSEIVLYILLLIAAIATVGILKGWNFDHFTEKQFVLENRSYLVMSIIFFVLGLKIVLLPYFAYTIDSLSVLVPGAMCAAGVIDANGYGDPLLVLKIMILFVSGLWLRVNRIDLGEKSYPYMKLKSWFFLLIFILLSVEVVLDILYFSHIETTKPVSCCSVIFGELGGNTLPFGLDIKKLLILFYLLYILSVLMLHSQRYVMRVAVMLFFGLIAYYSIVYFFGTYIYELPTHRCPFCMLQAEYFYVGYILWGLLFMGMFLAIESVVLEGVFGKNALKLKKVSIGLLTLFVLLCSSYVGIYYLKNGVFL